MKDLDDTNSTLDNLPPDTVRTKYWHTLDDGRVQCDLCPRACKMKEGQRGLCFIRQNTGGEVVMTSYGRSSGFCIDPIEKKPLNHFYPGTAVLSLGTAGCNLSCNFCQNWDISKARAMDSVQDLARPEAIAEAAVKTGSKSVAFTYNDPVIFHEYAIDIAAACHEVGVKTVAVTAGYVCDEPRKEFYNYMDAANVDLKAFSEDFYWRQTKSALRPVLDTLEYLKHETDVWFEITTLLIPDENDSTREITEQCEWMVEHLGTDVPIHFSAFHPDYRMKDKNHTPPATLKRARKIALDHGLKYVYTGNVHNPEGDTTYCPGCHAEVINRDWYQINNWGLTDKGECKHCGYQIAGRFDGPAGNWGRKRVPVRIGDKDVTIARPVSKRAAPPKKQHNMPPEMTRRRYEMPKDSDLTMLDPQVAGMFYPDSPSVLATTVDQIINNAAAPKMNPKAIIAPHAGYVYSGQIAGSAYKAVEHLADKIKKIVLFGPPHRMPVKGICVPDYDALLTPLGPVTINKEGRERLKELDFVYADNAPFKGEHDLEVQLPFIQRVFEHAEIIPALVGQTTPEQVAEALDKLWGGEETLIIISSDLSHYEKYDDTYKLDNAAAVAIETLNPDGLGDMQACGRHAIRGLLVEARRRQMRATTIDLRNSGDTKGDKSRCVGYGAFIFEYNDDIKMDPVFAENLLTVAKAMVIQTAKTGQKAKLQLKGVPRSLMNQRGVFVTINKNGQLRGCYGSFLPNKPMVLDVAEQAFNAGFQDPRFKPLTVNELKECDIGLSVLSIPGPLEFDDEADLLSKMQPNIDGLILKDGRFQGLFLPQVWESLTTPEDFLKGLKRKAGLPEDHWSDTLTIQRFTAEKIGPVSLI
ncbi:MAG: AmmeMemoRadiSam system radical SAM enzyme [Pseudomonadota bacterium]|jgi:pyruvate formate lyase activating enzyme|nr:AmmeMemoRadiSam system radical SAM enzyme [Pseudomonadota bacterium]